MAIGMRGFEPPTPGSPSQRSDQTELHSVIRVARFELAISCFQSRRGGQTPPHPKSGNRLSTLPIDQGGIRVLYYELVTENISRTAR